MCALYGIPFLRILFVFYSDEVNFLSGDRFGGGSVWNVYSGIVMNDFLD